MKTLPAVWHIFKKDLLLELRTREVFFSIFIFALLILVLFNFAFEPSSQEGTALIPGMLWVSFTFAGILGLNRTLGIEKENSGLEALMLCPIKPEAIYLGKWLTNLILMLLVEMITLPFFIIFFNVSFTEQQLGQILLINLLGTFGFSLIGTLFSTIALNTKMRDVLLPVLLFPVSLPVLMSAVECTSLILTHEFNFKSPWFKILAAYDVIFLVVCLLVFEYVLEE
jgi:heme exporter protein B